MSDTYDQGSPSNKPAQKHTNQGEHDNRWLILGLVVTVGVYLVAFLDGIPQKGTEYLIASEQQLAKEKAHTEHSHTEHSHTEHSQGEDTHQKDTHQKDTHQEHARPLPPPAWTVLPFVLLLGAIAAFPLIPATEHWWERNRNRLLVSVLLGSITLLYYLLLHESPVEKHWLGHGLAEPNTQGPNWRVAQAVLENAMLEEYVPFIVLLFSLYVIAGGIWIAGDVPAHPLTNTLFLAVGTALASFIGTTGAAMVLIRALLQTNKERRYKRHTVVFFILTVCNCGGLLLPIGDPPLFLGYLRGVPFLWTFRLFGGWLLVNGMLLVIYYLWDHYWAYPKERPQDIRANEEHAGHGLRFYGLWNYNLWLILGVVLSVALLDPTKTLPGTDYHPPVFLREIVQLTLVLLSLLSTPAGVREANGFSYHAILEVAALFIGIFICMQPAMESIGYYAAQLPEEFRSPTGFFWCTGLLSAMLDNAPTYLVFFQAAQSLPASEASRSLGPLVGTTGVPANLIAAISMGSVFMGALTYIGNGPNFMVKAIAERNDVDMPSFLGYAIFSMAVLGPVLIVANVLFKLIGAWSF